MDYKNLYQDIHRKANEVALKTCGENLMIYPCGFAAIHFKKQGKVLSRNHPFVQWAVEQQIAKYDNYRKCYYIWVGHFNQSMLHKSAYANEFVRLLEENEIPGACAWENAD
jgi:hypothetical protein